MVAESMAQEPDIIIYLLFGFLIKVYGNFLKCISDLFLLNLRTSAIILITLSGLLSSCYKVYVPQIDTDQKVLVVNGMITNQAEAYHILLSYAKPFNSNEKESPVSAANVSVTDDQGISCKFAESDMGDYKSDSMRFIGYPGRTYRLHIFTPDGEEYESDPQQLFPETYHLTVYAEFDTKETLDKYSGLKVNTHGANILSDILNDSDSIPRYRITSNLLIQYYYYFMLTINYIDYFHFDFFCWQTVNPNPNISLTGGEYFLNSATIRKHPVCFFDDYSYVWALIYNGRINKADTTGIVIGTNSYKFYEIHHRILYLNVYTLNNETYLYYKSLNGQMQAEGKLFDPIAVQLNGNIKCITNPDKKAIGFFEASSVSYSAYIVDFRNMKDFKPSLIKTPYILPPEPVGLRMSRLGSKHYSVPSFWILK
jgi:hypothetical protein